MNGRIAFLLVWACLTAPPGSAGDSVLGGPEERTVKLDSRILGEERTLSIALPAGYGADGAAYPVLYVLDAEARPSFAEAVSAASEVRAGDLGPEMIVVGIWNTNRNRDMIPEPVARRPGSGGSRQFLSFLHEELIPCIGRSYRTSDFSVLYGASNAGLFTVYALLERPETFDAYIASSPTLGHCPDFMRAKAEEFLKKAPSGDRMLYLVFGEQDAPQVTGFVPDFQRSLEAAAPAGFRSRLEILSGEGHVPRNSLSRGLRFVFESSLKRRSRTPDAPP